MIDKEFDILQICKKLRISSLQLKCLLDLPQQLLSKQLAKYVITEGTEKPDSSCESEKDYTYLNEIFLSSEERTNKNLVNYFLKHKLG